MTAPTSTNGRLLAILGAALLFVQLWPITATTGTLLGILHAFRSRGISDPAFTGAAAGEALITTVIGSIFAMPSASLLIIALTRSRYRAPWFFWFLIIDSGLLLFLFPIGTAISMFFLVYCLSRRHEFLRPARNEPQVA